MASDLPQPAQENASELTSSESISAPRLRAHRLPILSRYILREVLAPTLLSFLLYTFVLLMNHFFVVAEYSYQFGVPVSKLSKLFLLQLPHVVVLTLPMSLLVGILVAAARLSADSELTALAASGMSFGVLLRPVLLLAIVFALGTGTLMYEWLPRANLTITRTLFEIFRENLLRKIEPRVFNAHLLNGFTMYVHDIEHGGDEDIWHGVILESDRLTASTGRRELFFAREARPVIDAQAGEMVLDLYDVSLHSWSPPGLGSYEVRTIGTYTKRMPPPPLYARQEHERKGPRLRTVPELFEYLQERGGDNTSFDWRLTRVEIHKRFAIPLACIVFAFLGLGLGAGARKSGRAYAFVTSLVIILVYYQLFYVGERLAVTGEIPPWLAMWSGNLLFGVLGGFLFYLRAADRRFRPFKGRLAESFRRVLSFRFKRSSKEAKPQRVVRNRPRVLGMIRLLDLYVVTTFLGVFALVAVGGLILYVQVTLFQLLDDIIRNKIALRTVFDLYVAWFPEMLSYLMPVSVLTSTVVTFSLLTRTNEITAMLVNGISLYRVVAPLLVLGVLLATVNVVLHDRWLPGAAERQDRLLGEVQGNAPRERRQIGRRWSSDRTGRTLLHFRAFDPESNALYRASIFELDEEGVHPERHFYAQRALFDDDALVLERGWRRSFDRVDGGVTDFAEIDQLRARFPLDPRDILLEWRKPKFMDRQELAGVLRVRQERGQDTRSLEVELATRLAHPMLPLVMLFVGLPFAFAIGKRGSLYGIGVAIVIAMVYWAMVVLAGHLGKLGVLPPVLAAWSPNIVFAALGGVGFLNLRT